MTIHGFDLQPGDCLLYKPSPLKNGVLGWFFGQLIALKTWNRISHVEIFRGPNQAGEPESLASRDGRGVGSYPFRRAGLAVVLRPITPLQIEAANGWFATVNGQQYDWKGLLCFTLAVRQGARDRMFCSEFATRWYRAAGLPIFGDYDADHIAPAQFLMASDLRHVPRPSA